MRATGMWEDQGRKEPCVPQHEKHECGGKGGSSSAQFLKVFSRLCCHLLCSSLDGGSILKASDNLHQLFLMKT